MISAAVAQSPSPVPTVYVVASSGAPTAAIWTAVASAVVGLCAVAAAIITSRRAARSVIESKHLEYRQEALLTYVDATYDMSRLGLLLMTERARGPLAQEDRVARFRAEFLEAQFAFRRAQVASRVWGDDSITECGDKVYKLLAKAVKEFDRDENRERQRQVADNYRAAAELVQRRMVELAQFKLGVIDALG